MFTYDVDFALEPFIPTGARALELMRYFGMTCQAIRRRTPRYSLSLTLTPSQICYIQPLKIRVAGILPALFPR